MADAPVLNSDVAGKRSLTDLQSDDRISEVITGARG
jgi:hypothetical protein